MWKKRKDIEGVSTGSAVVFQEEQAAKSATRSTERRSTKIQDILHNKGVSERGQRDLDGVEEGEVSSETIEAKLRAKAELYDRMKSGGYKDDEDEDDPYHEPGGYMVDFEQKEWNEQKSKKSRQDDKDDDYGPGYRSRTEYNRSSGVKDGTEETRKLWEREAMDESNKDRPVTHTRKMDIIDDVVYETKKGREKHQEAKMKRKQALEERMKMVKERVAQQKAQQKQQIPPTTQTHTQQTVE